MSKFNKTKSNSRATVNYMGAKAYKYDERFELVSTLLTTFVEDAYYRKAGDTVDTLKTLITLINDKEFVAKATIYARNVFNMRSVTHVMASELAKDLSGKTYATSFYEKVVSRPDDMLEIAAYHIGNEQKLTNAMRKGFRKAFNKFDAYQLAKYRGENKAVKLVDMVNMVHPKPTQRNEVALKQLVDGELKNTNTWESKLTKAGQTAKNEVDKAKAKRASWEALILERKIGYMALLRNLRNIIEAGVSKEALAKACAYLENPTAVKRSKQFPFRFLSAYAEIEKLKGEDKASFLRFEKNGKRGVTQVLKALENAMNVSIANLPLLEGKTVILTDNSGSMRGDYGGSSAISAMSKRTSADIANLFAVMYWGRCENTLVGLFGDRLLMPTLNRKAGLFDNFKKVHKEGRNCGGATETGIFTMFERLIKERTIVDRIVIFSDMQIGTGCSWFDTGKRRGADFNKLYEKYRKINPNVSVYSVDLRGSGTTVFKDNVYKIAGWSEKIFNIMELLEQDKNALITEIEKIEI